MRLTILIPAYNEKGNLEELTLRFLKVLSKLKINYKFLYIIEGDDGCYESMLNLQKEKKINNLKMLYSKEKLGIGNAYRKGLANLPADTDYILTIDGDLNHLPEDFPRFLSKLKEGDYGLIIGSRKVKGASVENYNPIKKILSGSINQLLIKMLGLKVKDLTSGYRMIKKNVFVEIIPKIKSKNHEFYSEFIILTNREGYSMAEVPINFKLRKHGKSSLLWFGSSVGYTKLILKSLLSSKRVKNQGRN